MRKRICKILGVSLLLAILAVGTYAMCMSGDDPRYLYNTQNTSTMNG